MRVLLTLTSVKRVSDLTALSVNPACIQLAVGDSKVVLHPNPFYQPKILSGPVRSRIIELDSTGAATLEDICQAASLLGL